MGGGAWPFLVGGVGVDDSGVISVRSANLIFFEGLIPRAINLLASLILSLSW